MTRITPAEGQLPSPAEPLPWVQPGLRQHLDCGQLPPCCPALSPRSAASARLSRPRPRPLWGRTDHPASQTLGRSRLTDLLGRRRCCCRCRHLGPPQPALALWHGGGAHTLDGHALPRPRHSSERNPEWARVCVGSDPWRPVTRDRESPAGCMGVAGIACTLGSPQVLRKGRPQNPKHAFTFHQLPILGYCTILSCDKMRERCHRECWCVRLGCRSSGNVR